MGNKESTMNSVPKTQFFSRNSGVSVPRRMSQFFGGPAEAGGQRAFRLTGDVMNKYTNVNGIVTWKGMSGILQAFHRWPLGFGDNLKKAGWTKVANQIIWNILIFVLLFGLIYGGMIKSGALSVPEEMAKQTKNPFAQGLYFAVVTTTTLGFGDITPATVAGQMAVTFHIILFFIFNFIWSINFKPDAIFS